MVLNTPAGKVSVASASTTRGASSRSASSWVRSSRSAASRVGSIRSTVMVPANHPSATATAAGAYACRPGHAGRGPDPPGGGPLLVDRLTRGEGRAGLVGERGGQQPLLGARPRTGARCHQEPALEEAAVFRQQLQGAAAAK